MAEGTCLRDSCTNPLYSRGLCRADYQRTRRAGGDFPALGFLRDDLDAAIAAVDYLARHKKRPGASLAS